MNYLKMFVRGLQKMNPNEGHMFSHFWEEQTKDVSKVKEWIEKKERVTMLYSVNHLYTEEMDLCEIEELENGKIRVVNTSGEEHEFSWDHQRRTIIPRRFWLDGKIVHDLEKVRAAVTEGGHEARAEDWRIKTGSIERFIDEKTFETSSGSIYEII